MAHWLMTQLNCILSYLLCLPSNTCPPWFTIPVRPDSPIEQPPRGWAVMTLRPRDSNHIGFLTKVPLRPAVIFSIAWFTSAKFLSKPTLSHMISNILFSKEITPVASSWLMHRKAIDLSIPSPCISCETKKTTLTYLGDIVSSIILNIYFFFPTEAWSRGSIVISNNH